MSSIVERNSFTARGRGAPRSPRSPWVILLLMALAFSTRLAAQQPPNDNFTNATVLFGFSGSTFGSTINATQEPNEPVHYNFFARPGASQHSVWFNWVAPGSGFVSFETGGSSFDTVLAAYTNTDLANLVQIASDDDGLGFSFQSLMTFFATAGTEYHIALDGYDYGETFGTRSGFYSLNFFMTNSVAPTDITFLSPNFTVREDTPGFATITVVSGGGFTSNATVDYFTTDGTAVAVNGDYVSATNITLVFAPGDTIKTFTVPIGDNPFQNSNKIFFLTLTNPTGEATLGANSNATVTIIDDETPPFVSPAGEFNIVWPLDASGTFQEIPLQATPIPSFIGLPFFGTNFFFVDFPQYVVTENETTPAGFASIIPTVIDYPSRSTRGALITVTRSAPAVGRVLVDFYATNLFVTNIIGTNVNQTNFFGTNTPIAQAGIDYYPVSGTLVFDDYQMSANFIVPVFQSGVGVSNRFFNVVLANPRPAPEEDPGYIIPTLGPQNFATVEILKVDNTGFGVSFERVTYRADEFRALPQGTTNVVFPGTNFLEVDVICPNAQNGYNATITVTQRRFIFPLQVGSDYADPADRFFDNSLYTDGTLNFTNRADYISTNTFSVNFSANQKRDSIRIPIINDGTVEFNEDILLFVSGTTPNPNFGPNRFANVTILYDDQPAGAADREWNPEGVVYTNPRFYNTPGANNTVATVVVQPDDKTLLVGDFDHVNSFSRNHVARFNFDGSIDASFNPGTGADGPVDAMALYPASTGTNANKILIGGLFSSYNGTSRFGIARLHTNGTLDVSFAPGNGFDGIVRAVALQNDGKAIIAGDFSVFNGLSANGICRLNADGSLDSSFNPGLGPNDSIWALAINESSPGNRLIYAAGSFTNFNGLTRSRLVRLSDSGAVDVSFDPGLGADGTIYALAIQADGKVLIGGAFNMYHTFRRSALARINPDGSFDPSHNIGTGFDDSVFAIRLQPDGKALVGGVFTSFNSTRRMGLARLFISGSLDTSFMDSAYNHFAGLPKTFSFDNPSFISSIDLQSDGNVMLGGSFTNLGGNLSVNYPTATNTFETAVGPTNQFGFSQLINYYQGISGRTNGHNSGGHQFAQFTRQDKTTRFNIARVIGGYTPGPGNLEYDPASEPFVIDENSGNLAVTLRRVDGRLGTAQVIPSTTNNTATFPQDFSASSSVQTWLQYDATINAVFVLSPVSVGFVGNEYFNVPITDDMLQEGDESFGLVLSNAFGGINLAGEFIPLGTALGHNDASQATIADQDFDHGVFNFEFANYTVNEYESTATITLIRTNGSSGAASVHYIIRNGTADTNDFVAASGSVTFLPGQTNGSFTVTILNNPDVELDETVTLILTNANGATLPGGTGTTSGTLTTTATLTIIDDDFLAGRLQFSVDNYTNNENDVNAVITVTRTGGSVSALAVQFQTLAGGTATVGLDYGATNGTLSWGNGDTAPKTFTVPLRLDGIVEGPESVLLNLYGPSLAGALGARTNATLWINDGDNFGALSFNQPAYESDENGANPTITVVRSGGSAGTVSVQFATSPIIASPGNDYRDTNGVLTFLPGEFSKTFQVPVIDNSSSDGDKTVQLALFNPVNATLGAFTNVVLKIVDDENINTPAGSLDTTFSTQSGANAGVYALVQQLDGRIIMAGDFTQVSSVPRNHLARLKPNGTLDNSFDIGPGADGPIRALALTSEGKLLVGGLFNNINSTNRNGIARLSTDGKVDISFNPGSGADNPVFALAVQPNDKVLVGGSFNTFNNITRPGLVRLNTNGAVDAAFNVGAGFNGSVYALAVQNDGKVLVGGEFISFDGVPRTNFVRLNANGTLDNTFNPTLAINSAVRAILIEPDGSMVIGGSFTNINGLTRNYLARLDKDGALDSNFLSTPALSGADNTVYAIKQQVDGKLLVAGDFRSFNHVTRRGLTRLFDADGGTDPTINFGHGANGFVAALIIQPDRRIILGGGFTEYDDQPRQYICRIYGGSIAGSGSLEYTRAQFIISESETNAVITLRRRGGTTGEVRVDAFTRDGTAHANTDYLSASNTLIFPEGETRTEFNIPILPNDVLDGDRVVNLLLANFVNAVPGPQPVSTLLIQDDETAIGFSSANYAINENAISGNATITLVRGGATNTLLSVIFNTVLGGTATPFADYIPTNNVLITLAPGELTKEFHIAITNDTLLEGNESVLLALSNPSGTTSLGISNATLNIIDDDTANGVFLFTTNNFVADEGGGSVIVTVLRTNGTLGNVSVTLNTSNLTATAFVDYIPTNNYVINFAQGETAKSIAIPIINDTNSEPDETVLLTLSNPTGGAFILVTNSIITIADNEIVPASVGFATNNFFVDEAAGVASITVVRTVSRRGYLTVDFSVSNGSALAGVDYFPTNGTIVFNDGEDQKSFTIPIVNDTEGEGDETVRLSLSNLQGSNSPSLILPTSTLTIVDDDSTLRFSSATYSVAENAGSALITVLRIGVTNNPVAVTYTTTTGGTATAGLDFIPVTGVLNWAAGDSAPKTFLVPIIDNNILNADRTVFLLLSNPVGISAYVTAPTNAVLTIVENETQSPIAGPVDPFFNNNFGANANVYSVAYDELQRLYVGGDFTQFHGLFVNRITRLTTNGAVDINFNVGTGADATVYSIAPIANALYIGGAFTNINGTPRGHIARLRNDGSIDTAFALNNGGANDTVRGVAVLPSQQQIIVGGRFTSYEGVPAPHIARVNADGTIDNTFIVGSGPNDTVRAVAVLPNGQVLIGGDFTSYNGFVVTRIARLNTDGSLDTTFDTGLGADGPINSIAVGPDGKILIAGEFITINGVPRNYVARLNSNGTVDVAFDTGDGPDGFARAVAVELDNHVIVAGDFQTFNGDPSAGVARLDTNGVLEAGFVVGSGADAPVRSIALVSHCVPPPILVMNFNGLPPNGLEYSNYTENCLNIRGVNAGHFHAVSNGPALLTAAEIFGIDGIPQEITLGGFSFSLQSIYFTNLTGPVTITSSSGGAVQVFANGVFTFDSTFANVVSVQITLASQFDVATIDDITVIPGVDAVVPQTFAIGGDFEKFNNVQRGGVAVITTSGSAYPIFDPRNIGTRSVFASTIYTNTDQPSLIGKVVVGGDFTAIVGVEGVNRLARLNIDGTLDTSFNTGLGPNGSVRAVAVQPDGKVIFGGQFTSYDFIGRAYLGRANADGTLDNTFNFGVGLNNSVLALALQSNGRIIIGGTFTTVYGVSRNSIARMNANGTVDTSFAVGTGANGAVKAVALQSDGKVLIGGDFTSYNGVARAHIARLNTNGTLDATFNPTGADGTVNAIAVTGAGQILIGGAFTSVNGNAASRLARLTSSGAFDGTFNIGSGANDFVSSIAVQPDAQIVVSGNFTTFNGQIRNRLVRLNGDGSLDPTINFGAGANDFISTITLQNYDGKIIVGGGFTEFDGLTRVAIARLFGGTNSGAGSFQFSSTTYTVNERATNALLTVVRAGGTLGSASVSFITANGTATAPVDYTSTTGTLNFAPAESVKQISIPVNDDSSVNGDRAFSVTLFGPSAGTSIGTPSTAQVTIQDNDSVFDFSAPAYSVIENAAIARITVIRSGGALDTATVDFATGTNGTATAGIDYTVRAGTLTFPPGVRIRTFDVPITDDTLNEFNETVPLSLMNPSAFSSLGLSNATLTIVENDFGPGVITFGTNSYFVSEDAPGIQIEVLRTNGLGAGVSVFYRTLAGSASANVDYVQTNGFITFGQDQTNAFITIYPIDDLQTEGNESLTVQLFGPTGGGQLGLANASLTIVDNDAPGTFVFSSPSYTVSEGGGVALITVLRTNGNLGGVSVTIQTSGGSATPNVDYTQLLPTVLTFSNGQSARTISIPIAQDSLPEGTETVGLLLSNPTGGTTIGSPGSATLSILDDEAAVGFASANFNVSEPPAGGPPSTNFVVTLVRIGDTNIPVSVSVSTSDGTATVNADYLSTSTTVTFAPGETNRSFVVTVLDDSLAEGDETVNLTLSSPSSGASLGPIPTATLTILDNDISFSFSSAVYATNEGTLDFAVTVRRLGFTGSVASVEFFTADGTATAGPTLDYLTSTGRLVFAVGQTSAVFTVRIQDDLLVEGDETINLILANPSAGALVGPQATAVLVILDNDTTVGFAATNYVVNEKVTNAVITLVRNGSSSGAVSVGFRTQNGTALAGSCGTAGADYAFVTNNVIWFSGDTAPKTILIPVCDDAVTEGAETVLLLLSGAVGATIDPAAASGTLTIVDDAGVIAFASASSTVVEGSGNALINLVRTGGSDGTVSVQWNVIGGSATPGQDYSGTVGTVVFANGETVKPIILPIGEDGLSEGIETVVLSLSNPTGGARVGSPSTATLSILDNDTGIIVGAGTALIAESFVPTNNIIEPGETVTILFALRNAGVVDANNVFASLVYTNGVTNSSPQIQNYGALIAGGDSVSRPFTFTALGTNGTRITATLLITNNGIFLGPVSFDFVLGSQNIPFQNAGVITIPATGTPSGPASPYPATLSVSGVAGTVNKLTVTLHNVTHTYSGDLDILLVAPNGTGVMLMSDAGAANLNNITITFDDAAAFAIPNSGAITNGSYRCANYNPQTDTIPPYPAGTGFWTNTPTLAAFNGINPNGVWSLYVVDDANGDNGVINGGWSLNIATANPVIPGADLSVAINDSPDPAVTNTIITYQIGVTNHGPATAIGVMLTNQLPGGATFDQVIGPGSYTINGNTLVGSLGSIPMNGGVLVTVTMRAPSVNALLTFDSTVGAGTADLNTVNNLASVKTTVNDGTAMPALFVARKNAQIVLSWQSASTNIVLQSAGLLNVNSWSNAPVTPVVSNGVSTVTTPMDGGVKFYRLKRVP